MAIWGAIHAPGGDALPPALEPPVGELRQEATYGPEPVVRARRG
eukprot:gene16813-biopygen2271